MEPPRAVSRIGLLLPLLILSLATPAVAETDAALAPPSAAELQVQLKQAARDPALTVWLRQLQAGGTQPAQTSLASAAPLTASEPSPTPPDGPWSELLPTARAYHTAIYDPVGDRMVLFGGFEVSPRNDTWAFSLSNDPAWHKLAPSASASGPSPRYGHVAIHDPVRSRMVVFGGFGVQRLSDVWAFSLTDLTWTGLFPSGDAPSARMWMAAVYDPVRDRMLLFGGFDGVHYLNDVWSLSLSGDLTWTQIVPNGTLPPGRFLHSATYDPVRDRMLIFGGIDENGSRSDTWALSLSGDPVWSEVAEAGPPGRSAATMIHDPVRDRLLVFGGFGGSGNDVWALSLSGDPTWSEVTPAGVVPPARAYHTAIYESDSDRMVVCGGLEPNAASSFSDTWALSLSGSPAWVQLRSGGPPHVQFHPVAIHDPGRDRMVVSRGGDQINGANSVWTLSLSGHMDWSPLTATGGGPFNPPGVRGLYDPYAGIYDPVRDRMIVFGGANDVWELSFSGSPAWTKLSPAGTPPATREGHSAIYDPVGDRMVIFGGRNNVTGILFRDAWALSLSGTPTWTALAPVTSAPPGVAGHSAIYDPERHRMVEFGAGMVWALTLADPPVWSQLLPTGSPPGGNGPAIYDSARDRMVVYAGSSAGHDDVVALSLSEDPAWTDLTAPGDAPSARSKHSAIYDPVRDRMVVFSGRDAFSFRADTWLLSFAEPPTLSVSLSPSLLWPPNHKLVSVHATVNAPGAEVSLVSVTSNEPDAGTGPDDVPNDIQGVTLGTADFDFQLRAERADGGDGRTYTACYEARNSGGVTSQCAVVTVPRHRAGQAALGASTGSLILTIYGGVSMSARSILPTSVSLASEDWDRTLGANGSPSFGDVDGDGIEDARFVFGPDPAQDGFAGGDVRYASWQAGGQFYLANITLGPVAVEPANPGYLKASISSNPIRGRGWIRYALPHAGKVRLQIYDTMGRQVSRLVDGWRDAGWHTVSFDGGGASQLYLYRLEWEDKTLHGKFAVVR